MRIALYVLSFIITTYSQTIEVLHVGVLNPGKIRAIKIQSGEPS